MNGKVHATAGIVFGVASIFLLKDMQGVELLNIAHEGAMNNALIGNYSTGDIVECATIVASSWLGSLLPDMDHPTSTMSKKFSLLLIPYRVLQFIFGKIKCTKDFVGHRGITHSLLFLAIPIAIMLIGTLNPWIETALFGLSIGIFSHLFMDMLNPMGVPLLLPFTKKKFRLLPKKLCIKTQ